MAPPPLLFCLLHVALVSAKLAPGADNRMFGHSIKNGHLVANTEITTFEHNCSLPPCTITQMHCPTAGPTGWDKARVRIYVDGEKNASVTMTLLELAHVGKFNLEGNERDHHPWGIGLFGHTAANGGVYSTVRIPFGKRIKITLESFRSGTYWFIVRGVEAYPVVLGDLVLPKEARLKIYQTTDTPLAPKEFITMANVSSGVSGAVLSVKLDATSGTYGYLEACVRAYIDGSAEPMFLSSGAEDYFLSAYYFNENLFKTPQSGLTYYDNIGTLSAYKVHDRDPILFNDGLALVFRNCEDTVGCGNTSFCPNQWCAPGMEAVDIPEVARPFTSKLGPEPANYSTTVFIYQWPRSGTHAASSECPGDSLQSCMDACPSQPLVAFQSCTTTCSKRCLTAQIAI